MLLMIITFLWNPITEFTLFSFREKLVWLNIPFYILFLSGILLFASTIPFFIQTDLFGLKKMQRIINNDVLEIPQETQISVPWIYNLCRHPMQTGIMMAIIFSSTDYHLGRVFLVSLFTVGVILGVNQEERLLSQIESYRNYKSTVMNKFIPDFTKLLRTRELKNKM